MPYRRRATFRRRPYRRLSTRRSRVATKTFVKKTVKREVQADKHNYDLPIADTAVGSYTQPAYLHPLVNIAVGDTQTTRTGKMIQVTGFEIKVSAYRNPSSSSHDRIRIVGVRTHNRPTAYVSDEIYGDIYNTDAPINISTALMAYRRLNEGVMPNYSIWFDKVIDLGFGATDKSTKTFSIVKRYKRPLKVWYPTDSATPAATNDLFLMAISDTSAPNQPLLSTHSRVWFLP